MLKAILIVIGAIFAIVAFIVIAVVLKVRSFAKKVKRAVLVQEALSSGLSVDETASKLNIKVRDVEAVVAYLKENPKAAAMVETIVAAKRESEKPPTTVDTTAVVVEEVPPSAPLAIEDHTTTAPTASADPAAPPSDKKD